MLYWDLSTYICEMGKLGRAYCMQTAPYHQGTRYTSAGEFHSGQTATF